MRVLVLIAAALAASACALSGPNAPSPTGDAAVAGNAAAHGRDCFNPGFVTSYTNTSRNIVRLKLEPGDEYDITLLGAQCDQVDWTHRVALDASPSSLICVGNQAGQGDAYFQDPITHQHVACAITNVVYVPPAPRGS
jgi:hypothetical protein